MNTSFTEDNSSGLKENVIKGAFWTMSSETSAQMLSFGVTIVLARILEPEDFEIVALFAVFVGFLAMFTGLGMGAAIIQRQNIDDDYLSTSFWVSIVSRIIVHHTEEH